MFLVMFTNFGMDMMEKLRKKKSMQKGFFFSHSWKMHALGCVLKVLFYEDDIQPEIQVPPLYLSSSGRIVLNLMCIGPS